MQLSPGIDLMGSRRLTCGLDFVEGEKRGGRYIPGRVRYASKQIRVRLIQHSFCSIFSEYAEFEVETLGKNMGD